MTDIPPYADGTEPPSQPVLPSQPVPPSEPSVPIRPSVPSQPFSAPDPSSYPAYPGYPGPGYPGAPGAPSYPPSGYPPLPPMGPPGYPQQMPWGVPAAGYSVPGAGISYFSQMDGSDLLVTAPGEGYGGWWSRLWKTFARSWRSILPIVALTSGIPSLIFAVVEAHALSGFSDSLQQTQTGEVNGQFSDLGTFYAFLFAFLLVSAFASGIGWSASIWTITKQAVGEPAPFGSAMAYGLRNGLRIGGWFLLYGLMVGIGTVCCILPGLYLAVAGGLVVPLAIYRSKGSLSDSFRIVHANFGSALGRFATLGGFLIASAVVSGVIGAAFGAAGISNGGSFSPIPSVLGTIIGIPVSIVLIIGVTLAYTELSAREYPQNTVGLNAAL